MTVNDSSVYSREDSMTEAQAHARRLIGRHPRLKVSEPPCAYCCFCDDDGQDIGRFEQV